MEGERWGGRMENGKEREGEEEGRGGEKERGNDEMENAGLASVDQQSSGASAGDNQKQAKETKT